MRVYGAPGQEEILEKGSDTLQYENVMQKLIAV